MARKEIHEKKDPFDIFYKWKRLDTIFNPKIPSWAKVEGLEHGDVLPQLSYLVGKEDRGVGWLSEWWLYFLSDQITTIYMTLSNCELI